MEIKITNFFTQNQCPRDYAASMAEIGQSAGADTWRAACEDATDFVYLDTPEKREAFTNFARDSGFSEDVPENLDALFLQWIAGDCREMGLNSPADFDAIDWDKIEKEQSEGQIPSNIFKGIDGEIYFYAGC
jgi:hypothetical protein